jgi:hypothetical protein
LSLFFISFSSYLQESMNLILVYLYEVADGHYLHETPPQSHRKEKRAPKSMGTEYNRITSAA